MHPKGFRVNLYHRVEAHHPDSEDNAESWETVATVGLTEDRLKRETPDALVITTNLGAVGFCYNPETHMGKHPGNTFVVKLKREQMDEIRDKAMKPSREG
jgi:hypothetical protein